MFAVSIFSSSDNEYRLSKLKASGVSLFGASWWAYAPFEALCIGTYLSIWVSFHLASFLTFTMTA